MAEYEYRVCRNLESDSTRNTLDLYPGPTFGIIELLDDKDSQYFARYLKKKRWRNITPEAHQRQKTYHSTKPSEEELRQFEAMVPDWFYLSGHYARTAGLIQDPPGEANVKHILPSGFFNEPFHMHEWETEWNVRSDRSLFLQTDVLTEAGQKVFDNFWATYWLRSPYGPDAHRKTKPDDTNRAEVIKQWFDIWTKPQDDVLLGGSVCWGARGLLTAPNWNEVKLVMLVGCNTLAWMKHVFRDVFPNALILGYINKNPANATPHIKAFLNNVFEGIVDRRDSRLLDHGHIAKAWMDVHTRQRLAKANRMAFMDTSGKVFGWKQGKELAEIGSALDTIDSDVVEPVRR